MSRKRRKHDQERTRSGKNNFLSIFMEEHCIIRHCCKRIVVHYTTFYRWKRKDQRFVKKMGKVFEQGLTGYANGRTD